jgi:hypothetical protein
MHGMGETDESAGEGGGRGVWGFSSRVFVFLYEYLGWVERVSV